MGELKRREVHSMLEMSAIGGQGREEGDISGGGCPCWKSEKAYQSCQERTRTILALIHMNIPTIVTRFSHCTSTWACIPVAQLPVPGKVRWEGLGRWFKLCLWFLSSRPFPTVSFHFLGCWLAEVLSCLRHDPGSFSLYLHWNPYF